MRPCDYGRARRRARMLTPKVTKVWPYYLPIVSLDRASDKSGPGAGEDKPEPVVEGEK